MRRLLAGLFCLLLLPSTFVHAETRGEVESIGFGSLYRPNCHVPMLIRVQADVSGTYQIRVVQEDLDRDQELFTQTVSLTGAEDGKGAEQRFWMYFIPQPTDGGLPDTTRGGNLQDLQKALKVFLCDEKGKQLAQLPVTQTISNIENASAGPFTTPRGTRIILAIEDGANQPVWRDYQQAIGTMEDVVFVTVRSTDLPEDVRGFEMVDAIVWLAAAVPDPAKPSDEKRFKALQSYVRGGGHLVVCQPAQRDATAPLADMLPVTVDSVAPRDNLEPLKSLATDWREKRPKTEEELVFGRTARRDDWVLPQPPFMFARATAKPNAIVDPKMIGWPDGTATPYIARIGFGAGCVTWVAQDLSDPVIVARAKSGWPYVWDRVLDYKHDLTIVETTTTEQEKRPYAPGPATDVGYALLGGMDLTSKSRALVSIAVVFFIAYWVIAGPGVYFYLLTKSKPQLSWFLFAASALVATLVTVIVVRLVVRGAPEMAHVSVVRSADKEPPISYSRFGLYVPRDEPQNITLPELAPRNVSYMTAYPLHPQHTRGDVEFPAQQPYMIPIRDAAEDGPFDISVRFRSTLKKFQIRRVGQVGGTIDGLAKLRKNVDGNYRIEGALTNGTGYRLRNIYLAFYHPEREDDWILFLPFWEVSQTIDLDVFNSNEVKAISVRNEAGSLNGYPEQKIRLRGPMGKAGQDFGWSRFWYQPLRNSGAVNATIDDFDQEFKRSIPMMCFFGRLPPMKNFPGQGGDRVELLRRGGRYMDMSNAIAAGKMVICAEADGKTPIPFPMEVSGEKVEGRGITFYEGAVPMQRIDEAPATQPTQEGNPAATSQPVALHTHLEAATAVK